MNSEADESEHRLGTGSGMLSEVAWRSIGRSLDLSRRHMEILQRLFDDKKESAIADDLGISPHTVHTHLERIYHKLGVHSRLELVQLIIAEFLRLTADVTSGIPPICGYWGSKECPLRGLNSGKSPDDLSPRQPTPE